MGRRSGQDPAQAFGLADVATVRSLAGTAEVGEALAALEESVPGLAAAPPDVHVLALHARAVLLRSTGAAADRLEAALDDLEAAGAQRRLAAGRALARAEAAHVRLAAVDGAGAVAALAGAYGEALDADARAATTLPLVESVADALARTTLVAEHTAVRERLDDLLLAARDLPRYAAHRTRWAAACAVAALHPAAFGAREPDAALLGRALELLPHPDVVVDGGTPAAQRRVPRSADAVRALVATYRDRPADALRLLGEDAFGSTGDLDPLARHVATLAAVRAHAHVGSIGSARSLDDAATRAGEAGLLVPALARARERLWLETHARGDIDAPARRVTALTAALAHESLDVARVLGGLALRGARPDDDAGEPRPGRRALVVHVTRLLREGRLPLALVLVDVDDVAGVNDRYSAGVGDEVLRTVAATLRAQLRAGDRFVRCGEDEFALLLPGTGDEQARAVAARLRAEVAARPWDQVADGLHVTVSAGSAALWEAGGRRVEADAERLVARAHEALAEDVAAGDGSVQGAGRRARRVAGPPRPPARRAADRSVPQPVGGTVVDTTPEPVPPAAEANWRDAPLAPADGDLPGCMVDGRRRGRRALPPPDPTTPVVEVSSLSAVERSPHE